jgi:hypothetical protein
MAVMIRWSILLAHMVDLSFVKKIKKEEEGAEKFCFFGKTGFSAPYIRKMRYGGD